MKALKYILIVFAMFLVVTSSGCLSDNKVETNEEAQNETVNIGTNIQNIEDALDQIDEGLG